VAATAHFLRAQLEAVADYLTKDEEVLGDTHEQKTALIALAANVLTLERSNAVVQQHIDHAVRAARQRREEEAVVERERQRLARVNAEAAAGEDGGSAGDSSSSQPNSSRKRLLDSNAATESTKRMIAEVNAAAKQDMSTFNAKADRFVQELQESLLPEENGDEEVMLQRTGPSATDFTCPYSVVRMTVPMANVNPAGKCSHHMDQASLQAFFGSKAKKEAKRCPVGGCTAYWAPQHAEEDQAFKRKMDRFFAREGSGAGGSSSSARQAEREVRDVD